MNVRALQMMMSMMTIPKQTWSTVMKRLAERAAGVSMGMRLQRGPEDSTTLLQQEAYKVEVETPQARAGQPVRSQARQ